MQRVSGWVDAFSPREPGLGLMALILTMRIFILTQTIACTKILHTMVMAGLQLIVIAIILFIGYVYCIIEVLSFSKKSQN